MKVELKPYYTTGEVAKICGLKSARVIAKLFDEDKIFGILVASKYQRKTVRMIPLSSLIRFMLERKIPLDKISTEVCQMICKRDKLVKMLEKSGKIGVFSMFNGLAERLMAVVRNLDPILSLSGRSEDKRRVVIFKTLIEVMEAHIKIRGDIATIADNSRKKHKSGHHR